MNNFSDLISAWPTLAIFAEDHGVDAGTAAVWKHRNSIPAQYWDRTMQSAARQHIKGVTLDLLIKLARNGAEERRRVREEQRRRAQAEAA